MNKQANRLEAGPLHSINRRLSRLIASIDSTDFHSSLLALLRSIANFDSAIILSYHRDRAPVVLFEAMAPQDREALFGVYFDGVYQLSPFHLRWLDNCGSIEFYRLFDIVPEGFFDCLFYTDYYLGSGLRDEIAYLVPVDPETAILVALGRTRSLKCYSVAELELFDSLKPVVASCLQKHTSLAPTSGRRQLNHRLSQQLSNFGDGLLTVQERRVAQLLLRGHSSKSCARELAISPTTERVHRRNIYAKLKVSSQAELFNRFLETLNPESLQTQVASASQ